MPTHDGLPPTQSAAPLPIEPKPRAVTWRSLSLGLAGVSLICALVPYNDYVLENTFLIGNFLPIGLVLIVLALVLGVNAPLRKWAPTKAIREAEFAIIVGMMLVGCAVPSSGLMRYLPAGIVGLYTNAAERPEYAAAIEAAHLPSWLLPTTGKINVADIGNSDVFKYFYARSPNGAVPYAAWVRPILTWGIFIALLWGLVLCLSVIVRRQWAENERLAFPLAMVYHSLIEAPPPGRAINALFSSRGFWIAASAVFAVHGLNALHNYVPAFPPIPLGYDMLTMLADDPWRFMSYGVKYANISFCMVGLAFFLQSKTAFSLWFFFLLSQVAYILMGMQQLSITEAMQHDQTFGGLIVMSAMLVYVGRQHWWMIVRHMFGRRRADETESRYLPYGFVGWAMATCFAGVVGWLHCVGMSVTGAIVITCGVVMMMMIVARILAETGLIFVQINYLPARMFQYPLLIPPHPIPTTSQTFFFGSWFSQLFHDLRESLAGFSQQSLRVADEGAYERSRRWQTGAPFIAAMVLTLGVAYFVSWGSMLKVEYSYASTLSKQPHTPLNDYGINTSLTSQILDPAVSYQNGPPRESHNALFHIGLGAAIVSICSVLRLTTAWWPMNPIGFILVYSYAIQTGWFSIFLGWLAKVVLVRLGGASLLKAGRPIFIGLVVGEAVAAAFWLIVTLVLNATGHEYQHIQFLPGMLWPF